MQCIEQIATDSNQNLILALKHIYNGKKWSTTPMQP